ncbi:MAG: glycosyltransferase family 2 protein, partial [Clostridiales Family XIII bacterium]|nr:glycosyltransferase family 2 protein [Clostridiales Family XIII bacterium]
PKLHLEYLFEPRQGKFHALNAGVARTRTEHVITIDADTLLYRDAVSIIVNHIVQEGASKKVGAVAGAVFVRNSRENFLTKLQEWDYFLSIAGIKRSQGLFQSTLVAQGAFSIYSMQALREVGGWGDHIGEDIVLSWDMLAKGYSIYYEPTAVSFTTVPTSFKIFRRQRARWARGMLEGLRRRPVWKYPTVYSRTLIALDYLLFLIDFSVLLFWIPGLVAAIAFQWTLLVGPATLLLLPLTYGMFSILLIKELRFVFNHFGLRIRKHYFAFVVFLLTYQMIMAPISFSGYLQEFFRVKRRWK